MRSRLTGTLAVALVAIVVAAGCSDADDDDAGRSDRGNEQQSESNGDNGNGSNGDNGADSGDRIDASDIEVPEGSDPDLRDEYIAAMVEASGTAPEIGFDEAAVTCLSTAFVDAAGTDALSDAVTPEELRTNPDVSPTELDIQFPDNAGDVFYDEFSSCADARGLILGGMAQGDADVQACLDDAVDDDLIKAYAAAAFVGAFPEDDPEGAQLEARIQEAVQPCIPDAGTGTDG